MEIIPILFIGILLLACVALILYVSYWFTSDIIARQIKVIKNRRK
jgi:hypothetical protein